MKKTLIALAVAGLSFNASAVVDLNPDAGKSVVPAKFASEYKFNTTDGTTLVNAANAYDAKVKVGFSISANNQRYVRFDVTGGEFVNAGTLTSSTTQTKDTGSTPAPVKPFTATVSSSGANYVIFEIKDEDDVITKDDVLTYAPSIKVKGANAVNLTYKLFETAVAAVSNDPAQALETKSGNLIAFSPALVTKFTPVTPSKIDVTSESKKFEADPAVNVVGQIAVGVSGALWAKDGEAAAMSDLVATGSKIEVIGDLSAGKKDSTDATKIDVSALKLSTSTTSTTASTISTSKATFDLTTALGSVGDTPSYIDLTLTVDGKTAINETTFVGKYLVKAADESTATDLPFGTLSELKKNGATAELNIALKPAGAYKNFMRISNKSGMKGNFFVTVIADDGKKVTFPLSDVAKQPAVLEAGASTSQILVDDVFAAAAAKGLSLAGEGKLRVIVDGQVPEKQISLQSYTLSKDGNSFATMNAF